MLYQLSYSRLIPTVILDAKPAFCQYIYFRSSLIVKKIEGNPTHQEKNIEKETEK